MAINQLQYSQRYEKLRAQGVPHEEADAQAIEFATIKQKPQKRKASNNQLAKAIARNWLLRKGRELYGGGETYLHETPTERRERVMLERE